MKPGQFFNIECFNLFVLDLLSVILWQITNLVILKVFSFMNSFDCSNFALHCTELIKVDSLFEDN